MESFRKPKIRVEDILKKLTELKNCLVQSNFDLEVAYGSLANLLEQEGWAYVIGTNKAHEQELTICIAKIILEANERNESERLERALQLAKKNKIPIKLFTTTDTSLQSYKKSCLIKAVLNNSMDLILHLLEEGILTTNPNDEDSKSSPTDDNIIHPVILALDQNNPNPEIAGTILQAQYLSVIRSNSLKKVNNLPKSENKDEFEDKGKEEEADSTQQKTLTSSNPNNKTVAFASEVATEINPSKNEDNDTQPVTLIRKNPLRTQLQKRAMIQEPNPVNNKSKKLSDLVKKLKQKAKRLRNKGKEEGNEANTKLTNERFNNPRRPSKQRTNSIRVLAKIAGVDLTEKLSAMFNANEQLADKAIVVCAINRHSALMQIILDANGDVNKIFKAGLTIDDFLNEDSGQKGELGGTISLFEKKPKMLGEVANTEIFEETLQDTGDQLKTRIYNNKSTLLAIANNGFPLTDANQALKIAITVYASVDEFFVDRKHRAALALAYVLIAEEGFKETPKPQIQNNLNNKTTFQIDDSKSVNVMEIVSMRNLQEVLKDDNLFQEVVEEPNQKDLHQLYFIKRLCIYTLLDLANDDDLYKNQIDSEPDNYSEIKFNLDTKTEDETKNKNEIKLSIEEYEAKILSSNLLQFLMDIERYDSRFLNSLNWAAVYAEAGSDSYAKYQLSPNKILNLDPDTIYHLASLIVRSPDSSKEVLSIALTHLQSLCATNILACNELANYYLKIENFAEAIKFAFSSLYSENNTNKFKSAELSFIFSVQSKLFLIPKSRALLSDHEYFSFLKYDDYRFLRQYFGKTSSLQDKPALLNTIIREIRKGSAKEVANDKELSDVLATIQEQVSKEAFLNGTNFGDALNLDVKSKSAAFRLGCTTLINSFLSTSDDKKLAEDRKKLILLHFNNAAKLGHPLASMMYPLKNAKTKNLAWNAAGQKTETVKACMIEFLKNYNPSAQNNSFFVKEKTLAQKLQNLLTIETFKKPEGIILAIEELALHANAKLDKEFLKICAFFIHKVIENHHWFPDLDLAIERQATAAMRQNG